jgi:phosphodiesterase/alkaline phosphatase D-like protein
MLKNLISRALITISLLFGVWIAVPLSAFAQTTSDDLIIYLEWVNDPTSSIVINWIEDDTTGAAEISYRIRGSSDEWTSTLGSVSVIPDTTLKKNTVQLVGLTPDSSYEFKIDSFIEIHNFRTLPAELNESVRFLVTGDVYGDGTDPAQDTERFTQISVHASAQNPYFIVLAGDIVHLSLENEYNQNTLNRYFKFLKEWTDYMITPQGNRIPMVVGLGNHELPQRFGGSPSDAKYFNALYSFPGLQGYNTLDFGDYLSLIVLNTDHTARIEGDQTTWLDEQLNLRSSIKHVFPIYHVSAYPSSNDPLPGRGLEVLNYWTPIFEKYNVKFAFEHDMHGYKRTVPLKAGEIHACGVRYFGEGGFAIPPAGKDGNQWYVQNFWDSPHFLRVDVSASKRRVSSFSIYGTEIDGFSQTAIFEPPTVLEASSIQSNRFTANWNEVCEATRYYLDVSDNADFSTFVSGFENKNMGNLARFNVSNLQSSMPYFYRIRAFNSIRDLTSENSSTIEVFTLPEIPTIQSPDEIQPRSFIARWSEVPRVDTYVLDISPDSMFTESQQQFEVSGENFLLIDNLSPNTKYHYRVRAKNSVYNTIGLYSAVVSLTTTPDPPSDFVVSNLNTNSFNLSWNAVENVEFYLVDISLNSEFTEILPAYNNLQITDDQLQVENLQAVQTYFIRVRAKSSNILAAGNYSQTVQVITLPEVPILQPPDNIRAVGFTSTWLPVERVTHYVIDIANDENFTSIYKNYENYNVGDVNEFQIEEVPPNTRLYYRVRAVNSILNVTSENSVIQDVNTIAIDPVVSTFVADETTILADGTQESLFTATIRANDGTLLDGVTVSVTTASGTSDIEIVQAVSDLNGRTLFKVRNNRAELVEYAARAINVDLDQKIEIRFVPVAPIVQSASNIVASSFLAQWESVNGAESYRIDVSEDENFNSFLNGYEDLNADDALSYIIDGLYPGNAYYYRVRAVAPTGTSSNSLVISVITPEADPNLSGVDIEESLVLADNMSTGLIELTIRGENGQLMTGVPVRLETENSNVVINSDLEISDSDGRVSFVVKSDYAGKVEFVVIAGRISLATKAIVDFIPVPPVAFFPELLGAIEFTAKWEQVNGATHYLLDAARDENFELPLDGYQNLNVGDVSVYKIVGLTPGSTYHYRVRAATETTVGESSNIIEVTTYIIDVEKSTVVPSMKKILANGDQHSEVTIVLISDKGEPLSDVLVTLEPANPDHIVTVVSDFTDAQGTAIFEIRSSTAGEGVFRVFAGGLELDTKVNIIFLFADGEIKLGNNYPNPFGITTKIPVTIPERMNVQLFIYNSNGLMVDKLEDRDFIAGYYEIEFAPRGLSSGVYFVRMIADGRVLIEKMMLIK